MNNCLICNSPTYLYIDGKSFQVYKCQKCGFGMTVGAEIQTGDYHRDEVYEIEEELFRNIFLKRFNLITKYIKHGNVLEIGCSTGVMLELFKENGFSVTGVELSGASASVALKRGINITQKPFLKANFD